MSDAVRLAACCLAALLAAGCATRATVVLLPEADGKASAVSVRQGNSEVVLDKPYAVANVRPLGVSVAQADPQEVQARYVTTIEALPAPGKTFVLYFIEGKDEFTEESKQLVDSILAEVAQRPVEDVLVVGHTDSVGNDAYNDALGMRRAETVRAGLIAKGMRASDVQAISRGKRALAVPTADNVAEPRNRRVEIIVR